MAEQTNKNRRLSARVDEELSNRVDIYVNEDPELDQAILVRVAVREYMDNHPHPVNLNKQQEA